MVLPALAQRGRRVAGAVTRSLRRGDPRPAAVAGAAASDRRTPAPSGPAVSTGVDELPEVAALRAARAHPATAARTDPAAHAELATRSAAAFLAERRRRLERELRVL